MSKIIDLRGSSGHIVFLGEALGLPTSNASHLLLDVPIVSGSLRYNPESDQVEYFGTGTNTWRNIAGPGSGLAAATTTTKTANSTSIQLLAPTSGRKAPGTIIHNNGATDLFVRLSNSAATLSDYDAIIEPGFVATFTAEYAGEFQGIWAPTASGTATVTEYA